MNQRQLLLRKADRAILMWHGATALGATAFLMQIVGMKCAQNYLQFGISVVLYLALAGNWMVQLRKSNWYIHELVKLKSEIKATVRS